MQLKYKLPFVLAAAIGKISILTQPSQALPPDAFEVVRCERRLDDLPVPVRRQIEWERREAISNRLRESRRERRFDRFSREIRAIPEPVRREIRREQREAIRDAIDERFND
jgi:hypothetical protein